MALPTIRERSPDPFPEPPAFRFGVATADHQCEAYEARWEDVRDVYERNRALQPRNAATDFWNRYAEDAELARGLGCSAFRLSLAWARLEPSPGTWDAEVFAHYRDVLRTLRSKGLEPFVTLHHNTWPIHVERRGGMVAEDFPRWFAAYAEQVAERLGDLITCYVTLNEPNQLLYGYVKPWWWRAYRMPPGLPPGAGAALQIGKVGQLIPNLFRAHAAAYDAINAVYRRHARPRPMIGANPLLLGVPAWLQRVIDRNATRIRSPRDLVAQGRRLTERRLLESGAADVVLAQLTLTAQRTEEVLCSEAYFVAHAALLCAGTPPEPGELAGWRGAIAAARGTIAVDRATRLFPAATLVEADDVEDAVARLRLGDVGLVLDDDVVLAPFARDGLTVRALAEQPEPYVAAVAPGNRDLLQAIDTAIRDFKEREAGRIPPTIAGRRANVANLTGATPSPDVDSGTAPGSSALRNVRRRGVLRVAVEAGIPGLCVRAPDGTFHGLEPDLARFLAERICGDAAAVRFVEVRTPERMRAVRSLALRFLDPVLRLAAVFSTLVSTNWWYLGMAGRLAPFLCPPGCGKFDYVGLDYYWGVRSLGLNRLRRLLAAAEQNYGDAPVWPHALRETLHEHARMFPGKPIVVIENGSVDVADNVDRDVYLRRHIIEVQRARSEGAPVVGYFCWSITSNREWGLKFDGNSDFGLYHIDLDRDPALRRRPTKAAETYREIVTARRVRGAGR